MLYSCSSMQIRGALKAWMLGALVLLAIMPASAAAASTISVNETEDATLESGAPTCVSEDAGKGCTLRAAIELADKEGGESTIDLPEGTFEETHSPSTLTVASNVKISVVGAGAEKTVIEGDRERSVFQIESEGTLTVDGVTVSHGLGGDEGGAFYLADRASLAVEKSTLTENEANDEGGAIFADFESSVAIKQSTISKNSAGDEGGAVYVEEATTLTIEESTLIENEAGRFGGAISNGGAVSANSSILIVDSTIQKNTSEETGGGLAVALVEGHGCEPTARTQLRDDVQAAGGPAEGLTIEKSTITENTAEAGNGGGIELYVRPFFECAATAHQNSASARSAQTLVSGEGDVLISQSAITDNRAEEGDADGPAGEGGGISEEGQFAVDPIVNSTIAGNVAQSNGGGVAASDESLVVLISDTVFDNEVEPREELGAKGPRENAVVESAEPGNNLFAEEGEGDSAAILLRNTIVAEPEGGPTENCEGEIESLEEGAGYNLDFPSNSLADSLTDTCGMSETEDHDLVGKNPELSSEGLHDNGGPTETIALLSTSPAIGVVPVKEDCEEGPEKGGPASVDQRGEKRPGIAGEGCDIGAYEYQEQQVQPQPVYQLSLSPSTDEDEAATTHTHAVTATVTEESASKFDARISRASVGTGAKGVKVTFVLTGQNKGVTGTCRTPEGAADPECETNAEGKVVFTYADENGAGADTIEASTVLGGSTEHASASMTWKAPPTKEEEHKETTSTPASTSPAKVEVLSFKASSPPAQCVSQRDIVIHIQGVKRLGIVSAVVSIDGKHARRLTGKHLKTAIDLVGLPKGTFTVTILAHTRSGHTLHGKRVYHTCHTKLPGRSHIPL